MRSIKENFPTLDRTYSPGEMAAPQPGGGGSIGDDDVVSISLSDEGGCGGFDDEEDFPIEPVDVSTVDSEIMQQWYPEDMQESAMSGARKRLQRPIMQLLRDEGIVVSRATIEKLDAFLQAVENEHSRVRHEEEEPHDLYPNDWKNR